MNAVMNRRGFLHATSAAAGGLMVGFHVPGLAQAGETPELNAWVQVLPDETVVIRIARSEMGQGTLTGLAQLVAEELECDWAREDRVPDARPEPRPQPRVGQHEHRRQPRCARLA